MNHIWLCHLINLYTTFENFKSEKNVVNADKDREWFTFKGHTIVSPESVNN